MSLVAGSYEKFIWGFSLKTLATSETLTLKPLFSYPSHTAPIKSVAVAGPVGASGGADDAIKIYDLPSSSEIGSLLDPTGAVSAISFFCSPLAPSIPRNLLAGSDDGAVRVYDADPFVLLKTVPVHRRGVSDLAVHPSGRLALTVGRDSTLAMVNLVRGRRSFSCRLDREATNVRYALGDGERFFMVAEERVTVHNSEDARLIHEMDAGKRVLCIAPGEGGLLFTGGEDRSVSAWDTASGKLAYRIEAAHSARVKGLVVFKNRSGGQTSEESNFIASASSDGIIRIWDVRMLSEEKPNALAEANTKSRLTCLAG
ncbi:protein MAK11 protein [Dioscorea alata]|nr:protein MAK11 protein [Dioscorea alata]